MENNYSELNIMFQNKEKDIDAIKLKMESYIKNSLSNNNTKEYKDYKDYKDYNDDHESQSVQSLKRELQERTKQIEYLSNKIKTLSNENNNKNVITIY